MATAFEAGIRHFDTAPFYGLGEAEEVLGEFIGLHRGEVTVTTKFGIEPPRRTIAFRAAVNVGRRLARVFPSSRSVLTHSSSQLIRTRVFSLVDAARSLERSLRALRTDCIDCYLLHDYVIGDGDPDELLQFLSKAIQAGTIRSFGIGASFSEVLRVVRQAPALASVVQFENSVVRRNLEQFPSTGRAVVTHGSLSTSYRWVSGYLTGHPRRAKRWSEQLNVDVTDGDVLVTLMIDYAVRTNPQGLVLFSSTSPSRIARNARSAAQQGVSTDTSAIFARLVAREILDGQSPRWEGAKPFPDAHP